MPSLQSQLLIFVMRNRHLLRFRLKREVWDYSTSIPDFRQQCEAGSSQPAGYCLVEKRRF